MKNFDAFGQVPANGISQTFSLNNIHYLVLNQIPKEGLPALVFGPDGTQYRTLLMTGCGHLCTADPGETQFPRFFGISHSGKIVCKRHYRICEECRKLLCIAGDADGFCIKDDEGKLQWYCTEHYDEEIKSQKRKEFWSRFFRRLF